jgi:hypothetical protein
VNKKDKHGWQVLYRFFHAMPAYFFTSSCGRKAAVYAAYLLNEKSPEELTIRHQRKRKRTGRLSRALAFILSNILL